MQKRKKESKIEKEEKLTSFPEEELLGSVGPLPNGKAGWRRCRCQNRREKESEERMKGVEERKWRRASLSVVAGTGENPVRNKHETGYSERGKRIQT